MTPPRRGTPSGGRIPTMLFADANVRMELTVSVPMPATAKLTARPAPPPPLDPPGVQVRSWGLRVCPRIELAEMKWPPALSAPVTVRHQHDSRRREKAHPLHRKPPSRKCFIKPS